MAKNFFKNDPKLWWQIGKTNFHILLVEVLTGTTSMENSVFIIKVEDIPVLLPISNRNMCTYIL